MPPSMRVENRATVQWPSVLNVDITGRRKIMGKLKHKHLGANVQKPQFVSKSGVDDDTALQTVLYGYSRAMDNFLASWLALLLVEPTALAETQWNETNRFLLTHFADLMPSAVRMPPPCDYDTPPGVIEVDNLSSIGAQHFIKYAYYAIEEMTRDEGKCPLRKRELGPPPSRAVELWEEQLWDAFWNGMIDGMSFVLSGFACEYFYKCWSGTCDRPRVNGAGFPKNMCIVLIPVWFLHCPWLQFPVIAIVRHDVAKGIVVTDKSRIGTSDWACHFKRQFDAVAKAIVPNMEKRRNIVYIDLDAGNATFYEYTDPRAHDLIRKGCKANAACPLQCLLHFGYTDKQKSGSFNAEELFSRYAPNYVGGTCSSGLVLTVFDTTTCERALIGVKTTVPGVDTCSYPDQQMDIFNRYRLFLTMYGRYVFQPLTTYWYGLITDSSSSRTKGATDDMDVTGASAATVIPVASNNGHRRQPTLVKQQQPSLTQSSKPQPRFKTVVESTKKPGVAAIHEKYPHLIVSQSWCPDFLYELIDAHPLLHAIDPDRRVSLTFVASKGAFRTSFVVNAHPRRFEWTVDGNTTQNTQEIGHTIDMILGQGDTESVVPHKLANIMYRPEATPLLLVSECSDRVFCYSEEEWKRDFVSNLHRDVLGAEMDALKRTLVRIHEKYGVEYNFHIEYAKNPKQPSCLDVLRDSTVQWSSLAEEINMNKRLLFLSIPIKLLQWHGTTRSFVISTFAPRFLPPLEPHYSFSVVVAEKKQ